MTLSPTPRPTPVPPGRWTPGQVARPLERAALLALFAFIAWGPLAQGSTFAGGRAGLTILGTLAGGLYLAARLVAGRIVWPAGGPGGLGVAWAVTLGALLAWTVLSTLLAPSRAVATGQGLLLLSVFGAALAAQGLLGTDRRRRAAGLWLLTVSAVTAAYVTVQHLHGGWTLQVDPDTLSAFYYHPSHYTGFVTLALPVCVWAVFQGPGWPVRLTGLLGGLVLLASLRYTNSSSLPTALLAAALAAVLGAWRWRPWLGGSAGAVLLCGVLAGGWLLATPAGRQTLDGLMGGVQTKSVDAFLEERGRLWDMDARATRAAPLTGVGPGHFVPFITRFRPDRAEGPRDPAFNFVNYAHNDYYQFAIELGLVGAALYGLLLLLTLLAAPWQDALGASLLAGLLPLWISGVWDAHATVVPGTMAWAWVACGAVAARPLRTPARAGRPRLPLTPPLTPTRPMSGGPAHE